jgi:hypothetical protein
MLKGEEAGVKYPEAPAQVEWSLHILVDFFLPFFSYKLTVYWIAQPTFRRSLTPHFAVPHFNHLWKHSQTDSEMCFANFQGIIQSTSRFTITF